MKKAKVVGLIGSLLFVVAACGEADIDVGGLFGDEDTGNGDGDIDGDGDAGLDDSEGEPVELDTELDTEIPVPITGVDILLVVDNSSSMAEEQQILSTAAYSLINSLTFPVDGSGGTNVHIGLTTTDMGLQYGWDREIAGVTEVISCSDLRGDDGQRLPVPPQVTTTTIESGVIPCTVAQEHCPPEFICTDGYCTAPGGVETVNCIIDDDPSAPSLSGALACLVRQGTEGCGVEQQLSAVTRALEVDDTFLNENHLLQVIVVTDENDCSVEDNALYSTPEWLSGPGELLNIACNYPAANNDFLFDTADIADALVEAKGGREDDVLFAAIVGVPPTAACQGDGTAIGDCLDDPNMELQVADLYTPDGNPYTHFAPACTRQVGNVTVTQARPGTRFVETAQEFGERGYIYSICNEDWMPAMSDIVGRIRQRLAE